MSVPALHEKVSEWVKARNKDVGIATEVASEQLLLISICPQYESSAVSKHYRCQLNLIRVWLTATMRKSNIDSHYNHKSN